MREVIQTSDQWGCSRRRVSMSTRSKVAWEFSGRVMRVVEIVTSALGIPGALPAAAESRHLHLSLLPPPSTSFVPYNFAISPDGRRLAFVAAAQDGGTALWVRSLAAGAAQQLTGTEGATFPFWSPDSRQVGFFQAAKLKSVDP